MRIVNINIGFNNGYINVLDKEQSITRVYGEDTIDYNITGSSIYKGSFYEDVCFTTGIDASSCSECASIYMYIENDNYNFIQNIFNLNITQDDEGITDTLDINGPVVAFNTSDYRKLSQNDFIFLDDFIIVEAEDESGINLMNGLGHSIRYWFNNEQDYNLIDIDSFQYTTNCEALSKGEFIIPISNLNLGLNTLFVEIWDNFNNRTISSITLNVDNLSFKAYDIYNFPNPFMEKTSFTFKTSIYPTDATISIFDLSGKKIKKLNKICHNTFCSINWDGTDFSNKKVKNGTYIYSLSIVNENKSFKSLNKITRLK